MSVRLPLCGLLLALEALAAPLELRSNGWTVLVDPSDLAVSARLANRQAISISAGQRDLGNVADLAVDRAAARWKLPARGVAVSVAVGEDEISIRFAADRASKFSWPVYGTPDESVSYIIPKAEGLLVEPRDPRWRTDAWPRRLDTMESFSLPLWGVMGKGWTLTYLMTNPFDNTFWFRETERGLSWRLEHEFKRHWRTKEFGIDVLLGPESPIEPARQFRRRLMESNQFVSMKQKTARTPDAEKLLGAAHVYLWSLGEAAKMFNRLRALGLDRLWLGISSLSEARAHPEVVAAVKEHGYLIGPYDSYDSIHAPGAADTWETAQFDRELYEKGAIVGPDGRKVAGFKKKGYWLSSIAARPYVERRVSQTFADFPFNSFFMDCDAAGDLRDNYSPAFLATQADDMRERLSRMQWVVDRYMVPIGSEDCQWYAAPVIHFAHGMMTPFFGWGDSRLTDRSSPYFLGGYWPPTGPAIFLKKVAVPDDYRAIYFDPRVRIPLFQTVFHDSVITTHHWSRPSLKFTAVARITELLELLYNVPPLYHLNPSELDHEAAAIARHYRFFSPLHRQSALVPMSDFSWLTPDRLVQKTTFGAAVEMIANFRGEPYQYGAVRIPAWGIVARHMDSGRVETFP
jgi:hypothetical protein